MPSLDILVEPFGPRKALLFVGCADWASPIHGESFDPRKALLFVGCADRVSPHRVWELVVDFVAGGFYLGGQFYIKGRQ